MSRDQTLPLPLFPPWQPVVAERRGGPVPCADCGWRTDCGGPAQERADAEEPEFWGCFGQCDMECRTESCDWTCPNNPALWLRRWAEVGGVGAAARFSEPLHAVEAAELPLYAPVIGHGKRRVRPARVTAAVIPLYEVVGGKRGGGYGLRIHGGAEGLRAEFKLRADCRVTLLSVGPDERLERFWQSHRAADLPRVLADLGLTGVTTPNFSFFTDAPRTHSLWNRARALRVAERLSAAGVAVIPHLNASNARDWHYWAGFLREHGNVRCVAKEFQTGLKPSEAGGRAFQALVELQQAVGRALHPVLVGGARYLPLLGRYFAGRGTVVDSRPFMNTVKRQAADAPCAGAGGRLRWRRRSTLPGASLDDLLDWNLARYGAWAASRLGARFS